MHPGAASRDWFPHTYTPFPDPKSLNHVPVFSLHVPRFPDAEQQHRLRYGAVPDASLHPWTSRQLQVSKSSFYLCPFFLHSFYFYLFYLSLCRIFAYYIRIYPRPVLCESFSSSSFTLPFSLDCEPKPLLAIQFKI